MALGNIFSLFCPGDEGSPGNGSIFDGRLPAEQEDLRVAGGNMPVGVEKEGLSHGAGVGHKDRLYLPAVKHVAPAGADLHHGLNRLAQEVVAIEIGAAIHEHAIFRIKLPDGIASPVVVNEDSL